MNRTPTIRTVVKALQMLLEEHQLDMSAALSQVAAGQEVKQIWPFFTTNIDAGCYNLLMIAQTAEARKWNGMPVIANDRTQLTIYGLVDYDEPKIADELIGEFGGIVKDIVNQRHKPIVVDGGYQVYFNETCPMPELQYGIPTFTTNKLIRAFAGDFVSDVCISVPDNRDIGTL